MRRVRLRSANSLSAFTIPFPNQLRIFCECCRCRQFRRIQVSPIPIITAKGRNPTLGRNSGSGNDKYAHKRNEEAVKRPLEKSDLWLLPSVLLPSFYSQPICRPLFCSSSQLCSGLKYSAMARVEISSPVASFNTLRQSSVAPFFRILSNQI